MRNGPDSDDDKWIISVVICHANIPQQSTMEETIKILIITSTKSLGTICSVASLVQTQQTYGSLFV